MAEDILTTGISLDFTDLQRSAARTKQIFEGITRSEEGMQQATRTLSSGLNTLETELGRALPTATAKARQGFLAFDATTKGTVTSLATASRATAQASEQLATGSTRARTALDALGTRAGGLLTTLGRLSGIGTLAGAYFGGQFVTQTLQAGLAAQSLEASFRGITGDAETARRELGFVGQTAQRLGFDYETLAGSYRSLTAASRGTNLEGESTRQLFVALSEAARVYGLSNNELNRALLASQQIISKGTVSSEELRQQLGEALPGAFQVAARAIGVSTAELSKMLEQGQLLSDDFRSN